MPRWSGSISCCITSERAEVRRGGAQLGAVSVDHHQLAGGPLDAINGTGIRGRCRVQVHRAAGGRVLCVVVVSHCGGHSCWRRVGKWSRIVSLVSIRRLSKCVLWGCEHEKPRRSGVGCWGEYGGYSLSGIRKSSGPKMMAGRLYSLQALRLVMLRMCSRVAL